MILNGKTIIFNKDEKIDHLTLTLVFISVTNSFAGLNAGIIWAGIITVVFFEMFRPVFSARFFRRNVPKPRR